MSEKLLEAIGEIREEYIIEADWEAAHNEHISTSDMAVPVKRNTGRRIGGFKRLYWIPALTAACSVILILALISNKKGSHTIENGDTLQGSNSAGGTMTTASDTLTETDKALGITEAVQETTAETYVEPRWDEKELNVRFRCFVYNGTEYGTVGSMISDGSSIGEYLGAVSMEGYDIYEDKTYEAEGDIYSITGISAECALALRFTEPVGEGYYIYINSWYTPETLEEFMDALDFEHNLQTVSISHMYVLGEDAVIEYSLSAPDREILLDLLSQYGELTNVFEEDYEQLGVTLMDIGVHMPVTGGNVSIRITDSGYIVTNILETGKAFFLGKENAIAFMNTVMGEELDWESCIEFNNRKREQQDNNDGVISQPYDPDTDTEYQEQTSAAQEPQEKGETGEMTTESGK